MKWLKKLQLLANQKFSQLFDGMMISKNEKRLLMILRILRENSLGL
jgi:hypothetical protein